LGRRCTPIIISLSCYFAPDFPLRWHDETETREADMTSDHDLIQRSQAGDADAFAALYQRHVRRIFDFIYFKTYHRETTEDLTSLTFMKALEALDRFVRGDGSVLGWLYRIAGNAVADHYRQTRPTVPLDDVWDAASPDDVAVDAQQRERFAALQEQLKKLPRDKRDILILRIWQDLPFKEIAEIMGQNEAQCKMAFYRLIDSLKKELPVSFFIFLVIAKHVTF
jgi:RNA polymerase sigma-70 factor, ECF subfamily